MVKLTDNSINEDLKRLSPPTGEGIVIDIGTGDGRFVYQSARQNPHKFYIGIDANPQPLAKISEKIQVKDYNFPELYEGNTKRYLGLTRIITPGMRLRGWLGFLIPPSTTLEYLQFSGGTPAKTVEFELQLK